MFTFKAFNRSAFRALFKVVCMAFISTTTTHAQQPIPSTSIEQIDSYTPALKVGFDSLCAQQSVKREKGTFFPTRETTQLLSKSIKEGGITYYAWTFSLGKEFLTVKVPINDQGFVWSGIPPLIETNAPRDKEFEGLIAALGLVTKHSLSHLGLEYRVDRASNRTSFCEIAGLQSFGATIGGERGIGFTDINGRRAFLVSYDSADRCADSSRDIRVATKGWLAIDHESGMPIKSSYIVTLLVNGSKEYEDEVSFSCEITKNQHFLVK